MGIPAEGGSPGKRGDAACGRLGRGGTWPATSRRTQFPSVEEPPTAPKTRPSAPGAGPARGWLPFPAAAAAPAPPCRARPLAHRASAHRPAATAVARTTVDVTSLTRAGRRPMGSGSSMWAGPGRAHVALPTSPGRRDVRSAAPWHFRGLCRPASHWRPAGPWSAYFNYIAPHLFACPEVVRSPPALHTCVTLDK